MKHTKLFLSLGLMSLAGVCFTFAQDVTTGTVTTGTITSVATGMKMEIQAIKSGYRQEMNQMKADIKDGYLKIRGNWSAFHEEFGYAKKYFIKPLTGDALSGSKALITTKNNAVKGLNKEIKSAIYSSGTIDWTGYIQKYVDIYTSFKTDALPYVAPTKLAAFNAFVDAKIATVKKNISIRQKNISIKEQKYQKAQELKTAIQAKKDAMKARK